MRQARERLGIILILSVICYGAYDYAHRIKEEASFKGDQSADRTVSENWGENQEKTFSQSVIIQKGDTLTTILASQGICATEIHHAIQAFRAVFNPKNLRPGNEIQITWQKKTNNNDDTNSEMELISLAVIPSLETAYHVLKNKEGTFESHKKTTKLTRVTRRVDGLIQSSLYADARKQNVPASVVNAMCEALQGCVHPTRDIHEGDGFELLYEDLVNEEGTSHKHGKLLYAAISVKGKPYYFYHYTPPNGVSAFYNEQGEAAYKEFLKHPLPGARVTSRFGMRFHPIRKKWVMHHGTDFAAPRGTPIYASSSGVVIKAGRKGHYGLYVLVRHDGFDTAYAHLSDIYVRPGQRIREKQVIGKVGSSGMSTAPHLHFEFIKAGRRVDPLGPLKGVIKKASLKLKGKELQNFHEHIKKIRLQTAGIPTKQKIAEATQSKIQF